MTEGTKSMIQELKYVGTLTCRFEGCFVARDEF